ncbi:MAG: hypothetical protein P4L71_09735 [Acetobacteraceae bacterium]|nr:hypothetical protein [Acetobacteraceae bacterium]
MLDLAHRAMTNSAFSDPTILMDRLAKFADEMETLGLPWAAAHVRNVAAMATAERNLADGLRS